MVDGFSEVKCWHLHHMNLHHKAAHPIPLALGEVVQIYSHQTRSQVAIPLAHLHKPGTLGGCLPTIKQRI